MGDRPVGWPLNPCTRDRWGKVASLTVAEWPDGMQICRGDLTIGDAQTRFFASADDLPPTTIPLSVWDDRRMTQFTFLVPVSEQGEKLHLSRFRWLAETLEIMPRGVTPFPASANHASPGNPFVGRFLQRTLHELSLAAEAFDEVLDEWKAMDTSIDGRGVSPLLLPSTATFDPRFFERWPERYVDLPPFSDGSFSISFEAYGRGNPPMALVSRRHGRADVTVDRKRTNSLSDLLAWFVGHNRNRSDEANAWRLLPADDADRWWEENTDPGRLLLPDDEVSLYQMLGEALPYVWPNSRLSEWASEQWPNPEL